MTLLLQSATALFVLATSLVSTTFAQDRERVSFERGSDHATVEASINGRDYRDYLLGARAGQVMSVSMTTDGSAYYNILPPGSDNVSIFTGSMEGMEATVELPEDGDYAVRVYLMGNDRDSGATVPYSLTMKIAADAPGSDMRHDAKVPGTDFHATGIVPCARYAGQPMGDCKFGVTREGNGNGAVTVFWPDAGSRVIFFENGEATSYDQSQADGDAELKVDRNADLSMIRIGDQRFEIVDAIIWGG